MNKVSITRALLDDLAMSISAKSGEAVPMTLTEMKDAVDDIQVGSTTIESLSVTENGTYTAPTNHAYSPVTVSVPTPSLQNKTYNVSSAGTATITADSGYDGLSSVAVSVPSASFCTNIADMGFSTIDGIREWHAIAQTVVDPNEGDVEGWIAAGNYDGNTQSFTAVPSNTTITPTEYPQAVGGYEYMMEGAVTVNAISSTYVGSGITRRSSSDLSASGATVTVPSGYYSAQASKAVASGTAGTPTATKGTVSNHSVSVTPSVTNTSGYISGGTINGTAVTVTASELASGNKSITENGTDIDVIGYSTVSVNVSGGTSVQTKTGTFTGSNGISVDISCNFAPDLIYVYGNLSGSTNNRGVISITIVKDTMILQTSDTSSSSANESAVYFATSGVSGYVGSSSYCRATYSNGTLTITTGANTSANRFTSGITYSYELLKWTT